MDIRQLPCGPGCERLNCQIIDKTDKVIVPTFCAILPHEIISWVEEEGRKKASTKRFMKCAEAFAESERALYPPHLSIYDTKTKQWTGLSVDTSKKIILTRNGENEILPSIDDTIEIYVVGDDEVYHASKANIQKWMAVFTNGYASMFASCPGSYFSDRIREIVFRMTKRAKEMLGILDVVEEEIETTLDTSFIQSEEIDLDELDSQEIEEEEEISLVRG